MFSINTAWQSAVAVQHGIDHCLYDSSISFIKSISSGKSFNISSVTVHITISVWKSLASISSGLLHNAPVVNSFSIMFIFYNIKLFFIKSSLLFSEIIEKLSRRIRSGHETDDLLSCCFVNEILTDQIINSTKNNRQKNWQRCLTDFCFKWQPSHNLRDQSPRNTQKNAFHDVYF